nr:transposase [Thiocystis minor]
MVVRRDVTEYRTVSGVCACGQAPSRFRESASAPVQFGAGLMAFAVSLTHDQHLPSQRATELLNALVGLLLSPATLVAWGWEAATRLAAPVAAIGQAVAQSAVAHADETGLCAGALHWLPVLCTTTLTFDAIHAKRGAEALTAIGLLGGFRGILVHDHWRAYLSAAAEHAFCNAHPLRELIALAEAYPAPRGPSASSHCCAKPTTPLARHGRRVSRP